MIIFLPVNLYWIPLTICVLVLSGVELRESAGVSSSANDMTDDRFHWEGSNCPQSWKRQMKMEMEPPSLELWALNDTKLLDSPSPTVIQLAEEEDYQTDDDLATSRGNIQCRAPYPVILLAAYDKGLVRYDLEQFHLTTNEMYNKSSYKFEAQTRFRMRYGLDWEKQGKIENVYYCQAVHNPCLKSREKLFFVYDLNSNSNPNSSSISPVELKSIFGPNLNFTLNLNLTSSNSSSREQDTKDENDQQRGNNTNDSNSESECEAFFYYEEFRDYSNHQGLGKINLRYRCEFSDGTPGTVRLLRFCSTWGRCRFLVAAKSQKAKNCWRPYISGTTCLNCTAQNLGWRSTKPVIPQCIAQMDGKESHQAEMGVKTEEKSPFKQEDATEGPEIEHDVETRATDHFEGESETEANIENYDTADLGDDNEEDESKSVIPMPMSRSVEGTPLFVGFPPPGLEIQRPFIRTDAYDQDDLDESTLVRMNPFPEIQLFNTSLQVTCDSNEYYTSKIFIFALEFQSKSKAENGKEVQRNLQFFPVDRYSLEERDYGKGTLNSQTLAIHLNRTDIVRIFCFAGIQNSYKRINASRPVRVLEYHDLYKPSQCLNGNENNSDLAQKRRPELHISYRRAVIRSTLELNERTPQLFLNEGDSFTLSCYADYPILVTFTFNDTAGGGKFSDQRTQFDTFQNHSSYTFELKGFQFHPKRESHVYRCQSLKNPCLHRSILYSHLPGRTKQLKFEFISQNDNESSTTEGKRWNSQSNSNDLALGSPANYPECEVLFFYKELEDFPGYEFQCEFPMEETGDVNFHYCDSLNDCANLYRNRRQPKVCVRKVETWRDCHFCEEIRAVGYRPFVVTCKRGKNVDAIGDDGYEEPRVIESTLGNFAVFGLPNQSTGIAPIYFSNEEIDSKATLFLEPFKKYQVLDASLKVTCVSSAYYMSSADVYFAKFYGGRNELQVLEFAEFKMDPEKHEWRISRDIKLGNDPGLTHIFCIGITWINSRSNINSSREIHLEGPEAPKIMLDAGNWEEPLENNRHLHGTKNLQMIDDEKEYSFLVNSENQSLVCHSHGFPTPTIHWETTARNAPSPTETRLNSSHSVSRILLPLIDAGVKGTYICTATNSQGKATASLKVVLKYPVNKLMVAIVTTSIFMFIGLSIIMALLWKRNRGLKKVLRDLTPEEVEEFQMGSRSVDPEDPHAEIYALPYDWSLEIPREFIELDETTVLGTGEFGLVRPGYIKEGASRAEKRLVAIKQAKPKLRAEEFKNILSEIKVMSHLKQHENVLQILAACTTSIKKCQVLVVMEFCEMGDSHKYLRNPNFKRIFEDIFIPAPDPAPGYAPMSTIMTDKLSTHNLIDFSLGIANGMNHLRQKKVVHGDLSARNVLLTKALEVKVSDFGYSTHLNYASYSKIDKALIPWRSFPIEALKEMKLSFKSDVWAFGVLLYEIFTLGGFPYSADEWSPEFVQGLESGKRLEKPEYSNDEIYAVMTDCWQKEPSERPTFQEIHRRLSLIKNKLNTN